MVEHLGDNSSCPTICQAHAAAACGLPLWDAGGDVAPRMLGPSAAGNELPVPLLDQLEWDTGLRGFRGHACDAKSDAAAADSNIGAAPAIVVLDGVATLLSTSLLLLVMVVVQ